jgi:hypothetical protein
MIRTVLSLVLAVHGLIHLLGFVKAYRLAQIKALTLEISRGAGLAWLFAAVLILLAAVSRIPGAVWWWIPGAAGCVLSQVLIFLFWRDAKYGTLANVILAAGVVLGYASWSFQSTSTETIDLLLSRRGAMGQEIRERSLAGLPAIVQTWLRHSNVVGSLPAEVVHLRQQGLMRTSPEERWMPFEAEQWFTTKDPGFVWTAKVFPGLGLSLAGRDTYLEGRGHMVIKLLSLIPVADAQGSHTDQGTLVRYLAEICWFPSAALRPYIEWEEVDSVTAKATMRYGGITASGTFTFTPEGEFDRFHAHRYYDRNGTATLEEWLVKTEPKGYGQFAGVRMPVRSTVAWKLEGGEFTWLTVAITDLTYDESGLP